MQRVAKKAYKEDPAGGEKFVAESLSRLNTSVDLKDAVKSTDLVVEAIVENMAAKHTLFGSIDKVIYIGFNYFFILYCLIIYDFFIILL